jgi:hypothetical protein
VTLEIAFLPIYPRDLVLPELERQRPARYETRTFAGQDGSFTVIDLRTGEKLRDNPMSRADASALAANLERAALLSEGEALAGAFVRSLALAKPRGRGRPRKPARSTEPKPEAAPIAASPSD